MLNVRWQVGDPWQRCYSAVIGANVQHSIANTERPLCILYLEKTSNDYRSILGFHGVGSDPGLQIDPIVSTTPLSSGLREALLRAMSTEISAETANELRCACLQSLNAHTSEPNNIDPRVTALLESLHARPGQLFAGRELAQLVGLSESRIQHVFKQEIGIPIRRYVLWMRLRHVLELALSGAC